MSILLQNVGLIMQSALMQVNTSPCRLPSLRVLKERNLWQGDMYNKVLLAFDGTPCAELALRVAERLAARGAELLVVAVADTPRLPLTAAGRGLHYDADQAAVAAIEKCHVLLDRVAEHLSAQGIKAEMLLIDLTESRDRSVARAIVDEAGASGSDLVILGSHGRQGFRHFLLGSVAHRVSLHAHCPVLLVPGDSAQLFGCLNPAEIYGQWPEDEMLQPGA